MTTPRAKAEDVALQKTMLDAFDDAPIGHGNEQWIGFVAGWNAASRLSRPATPPVPRDELHEALSSLVTSVDRARGWEALRHSPAYLNAIAVLRAAPPAAPQKGSRGPIDGGYHGLAVCDCGSTEFRVGLMIGDDDSNHIRVLECRHCQHHLQVPFQQGRAALSSPPVEPAAGVEALRSTPVDGRKPQWRMEAYYYDFEPTGLAIIDLILSAVACAGKSFQNTEDWHEEAGAREHLRGDTPVERIQNAANDAAAAIRPNPGAPTNG